jgi:hypothetical protein
MEIVLIKCPVYETRDRRKEESVLPFMTQSQTSQSIIPNTFTRSESRGRNIDPTLSARVDITLL